MLRSLLAFALLLPAPAIPQAPLEPSIPKVICRVPGGYIAGSAVRIGPSYLVTAKHVINNPNCEIDGQPVTILYKSPDTDFAILEDKRAGRSVPVDCEGFKAGHEYLAVGHARGRDDLLVVPMIATGEVYSNVPSLSLLSGIVTAQPGQSGGAIIDADSGKVVGIVNTGSWSDGITGSIELKTTSVCA